VIKYVVGLVFIALTWAAALVFRGVTPLIWVAVIVTVMVGLGLITIDIVRLLLKRRAAAVLEQGLGAGAGGGRPDQQVEIAAMQAEFQKALRSLKYSRLGHGRGDALGALPWYVIIGPPGSGKTTALRSSGLPFPHAKGGRVKGVGGTRNCDWWLTNEAVILDTAGRWATQDDDREEWLAFLDLLRQTRPKKPVNGILVAVSVTDLQGDAEELATLSKALRERVDEVMGRLEMVLPVYLLVTKCDLVIGFVEMFGDLRDKERGQIWGFTLPLLATADERVDMFEGHLDELLDVIEQKSAVRMYDERRVEARASIFEFPQQMATLKQTLSELVADLFLENVYQDAPIMRGLYFTSGTQEGRPIDRIMKSMAEAFGVPARAAAVAVSKARSYFLRDVFTEVVFADKDVAIRSSRVLVRQRIRRLALAACALVAAAGFLFLPVRSYSTSRQFTQDAHRFVDKLAVGRPGQEAPVPSAKTLESVEAMAKILEQESESSVLFPLSPVNQGLRATIERLVVRPILRADMAKAAVPGGLGRAELMDALVLHLLLTGSKQPDEPTPRTGRWADAVTLAGQKVAARWESLTGSVAASRAPRVADSLVRAYATAILDPSDLMDRDRKFVSVARAVLIGAGDDPLAELINDPAMPRDLKLVDVLGGAVVFFVEEGQKRPGTVVRGAFTPAGYRIVKQRLEQLQKAQDTEEDSWILGKERKAKDAKTIARIKAEYFVQYLGAWKAFLLTLAVREPGSLEQARTLCKRLALEKPFETIWHNLAESLNLKDESLEGKALGLLKDAADKVAANKKLPGSADDLLDNRDTGAKQVAAEFDGLLRFGSVKPSGFDQYNQILGEITTAMGDQGTPEPKAFQTVLRTQRNNLTGLIARYNDRGWEQGLLERILMPPLRGPEVAIVGASSDLANRKWCETVVVAYDDLLAGKFPFASGQATGEARLADVEKFFQPGTGVLWQYFTDSLQADIERVGSVFRVKEGVAVRYRDEFLKFWTRAQDMSSRLFAREPGKLGMPVEVRIHPSVQYSKIVLDTGSKRVVGLNAVERWDEILWPSRRALVRLYVKSDEVESLGPREDGDWALFHLLGQGSSPSRGGEVLSLSFVPTLGQGKVQIDFKPDVLRDMFARFVLPRSITHGAVSCRK
jgi:type VI secretion system protein ImpL